MITVKTYLYPNRAVVQVFDPAIFNVRNRVVYSRPIKVYQGIDNPIQVVILNQDQKPADLTGYVVEAQIQDPTNRLTVETFPVDFSGVGANIAKGLGNFTIDKPVIDDLEQRFYKLTFKTIQQSTNINAPLYIDDNYGVPLDLEILPAYWSDQQPAPNIDQSVIDGGSI